MFRYITQSSAGPRVTRVAKLFLIEDRAAFKAHLERLAGTPERRRIIVSHHETIAVDAAGALGKVARTL